MATTSANGSATASANAASGPAGGSGSIQGSASAVAIAQAGPVQDEQSVYGLGNLTASAYATQNLSSGSISGDTVAVGIPANGSTAAVSGTFTQSGSSSVTAGTTITVDQGSTYAFNGNNPSGSDPGGTVTAATLNVGVAAGSNTFNQSGGTTTVTTLNVSNVTSVSGALTLSGGTLTAGTTTVGSPDSGMTSSTGTGTLSMTGGTFNYGNLNVVQNGTVTLAPANTQVISGTNINVTSGALNVSGGTVSASALQLNGGATVTLGTATNSGVSLTASSESLGSTTYSGSPAQSGNAVFNQANGSNSTGSLTIAALGPSYTSQYNLSGGTLTLSSSGDLYIGENEGSSTCVASFVQTGGTLNSGAELVGFGPRGFGSFTQSGGTNSTGDILIWPSISGSGTYTLTGGTLDVSDQITVETHGIFEYDGGSISGSVSNAGTFNVRGGGTETLTGNFTNESTGTLKTYGTTFAVTGTFTNNGTYNSDPATNKFGTLVVGNSGTLLGAVGDKYIVSNNLLSSSTNSAGWNTMQAELAFAGGDGSHVFDVNGVNDGATFAGYQDNFAWGELSLAAGQSLDLVGGGGADSALYVGTLQLGDGLEQLAEIDSNGVDVYYDTALNPLFDGNTFSLPDGGELIPVLGSDGVIANALSAAVPEPGSVSVLAVAAAGVLARRRRRANSI